MSCKCVCLTIVIFCLAVVALGQQAAAPSLSDLEVVPQAPKHPKTAADVAKQRAYYDESVWAAEVMAEEYESTIIRLWDRFVEEDDKSEVLATAPFRELIVNTTSEVRQLDDGISSSLFRGPSKTFTPESWKALLDEQKEGYEIVSTEWQHSAFHPPRDGPARSVISVVLRVRKVGTRPERLVVRGDLGVTWSNEKSGDPPLFVADRVDATNLRIVRHDDSPAFDEARRIPFKTDATGKTYPEAIGPLILQDLNGDHLPEVLVVGANEVFWNGGNWKFAKRQLCDHPSRSVRSAVAADFTGDGVPDLLCGLKNGNPQLYEGTVEGAFPTPPRVIRVGEVLREPSCMTAGDIDGDGDVDVFIGQSIDGYESGKIPTPYFDANDSFASRLLVNDGRGNFHDAITDSGLVEKSRRRVRAATLVDLDDDGDLDLLLTSDFCGNDLFLNDGSGIFTDVSTTLEPRSYANGMSHTFGDYNRDGRLDFLMCGTSSTSARRLDGLELGRADFPEHNRLRPAMSYGNRLFLNTGQWDEGRSFDQGDFNDQVARTGWPSGSTTLDFDRDGDQDVFVTNGRISGKTTRDYAARFWCHDIYVNPDNATSAAIADYFRKFRPLFGRLFSWHGYEHNALLTNLRGEGYVDAGFLMNCDAVVDSRAALSGDLDLDGRVDLIFERTDLDHRQAELQFMRNQSTDRHHWVGVHLVRSSICHSTMGAKVTVHLEDGSTLLQHRLSGHSSLVQHADTIHFGLGASDQIRNIVVRWPNGTTTELSPREVDKYYEVGHFRRK